MLIKESQRTVQTSTGPMVIVLFEPRIPSVPHAKFPAVLLGSEIYQVSGPIARAARSIAGHGYICCAPNFYHEFMGPEPLSYDDKGTAIGNQYKVQKEVGAYDEDIRVSLDYLEAMPNCTGKMGAVGFCLGGHIAFRTAFDKRCLAAVCFFGTDIHSSTLGKGKQDDSLARASKGDIKGELLMIFGKQDTHVPREGRDLIRRTLDDAGIVNSFLECQAQHAFVRDELSKDRYDSALSSVCLQLMYELFSRTIALVTGAMILTPNDPSVKEIQRRGWKVESARRPISNASEIESLGRELDLTIPEMPFGNSYLRISHENGFKMAFEMKSALAMVDNHGLGKRDEAVKVVYADEWAKDRERSNPLIAKVVKPYDWTYTTRYAGHSEQEYSWAMSEEGIPMHKLMDTSLPILFYDELVLFEDELGDNGSANLSLKVRVMPTLIFVLLRFFLRVDGVLFRIYDTRLFIDMESSPSLIIRERSERQASYEEVAQRLPDAMREDLTPLSDQQWVGKMMREGKRSCERLLLS